MIAIAPKTVTTEEGLAIVPDGDIPIGWCVRYIGGEFRTIAPGENWPEEMSPTVETHD